MIDVFTLLLSLGVLAHLSLAAVYLAFHVGASRLAGGWLCLAWAMAIGWRLSLHSVFDPHDMATLFIWSNVLAAAIACNVSIWLRASDRGWGP